MSIPPPFRRRESRWTIRGSDDTYSSRSATFAASLGRQFSNALFETWALSTPTRFDAIPGISEDNSLAYSPGFRRPQRALQSAFMSELDRDVHLIGLDTHHQMRLWLQKLKFERSL